MRVLFIQQDHVSPVGPVGEAFADRGYSVDEFLVVPAERFESPHVEVTFPDPSGYDAIVPMGARWSVNDRGIIGSWLAHEIAVLRRADEQGVPVLGICFGGQALAEAHGGRVERAPASEIGWTRIETDDESFVEPGPWFHWHHDRWVLPPGAVEVARTAVASQAFVLRRNLGVQFHPELTAAQLEAWLANGGQDYLQRSGRDPAALLAETRRRGDAAAGRTRRLVDRFLDRVARRASERAR
jgi:GMP synthase-like glutamine amidotransferase